MGTKLNASEAGAYEDLDRLLFRQWDPIGIRDDENAQDEYRSYLPGFWDLARAGEADDQIVEYLAEIERERIGVQTTYEHKLDVVKKAAALIAGWRLPVRT